MRSRKTSRNRKRSRRKVRANHFPLRGELLEDRRMLAVVITVPPNVISSAAGLFDEGLSLIPQDVRDQIFGAIPGGDVAEEVLNQIVDAIDSAAIYQAFPGEVNDVSVASDFANLVLLINESSEVSLIKGSVAPALPAFAFDTLLETLIPDFEFGLELGGNGGPVIVKVDGDVDADVSITGDQIRAYVKSLFDISSARAMLLNPSAFLDFIPGVSNVVDVIGNIIDFDITDVLDFGIDIEPIVDIDLPFGLPDIEFPPDTNVNIADFLDEAGIPTSFRELADVLPGPVGSVFDIVTGAIDFLTGDLVSDRIFVSTLDGPDNISFPNVTGLPFTVYAGTDNDTITIGGGSSFVDSLLDVFDVFDLNQLFDDAPIELYGQGGPDTFILTRRFNNRDLTINGGSSNDQLIVRGSNQADIIEIEADANGVLQEIRYLLPDPNGNVPMDETQIVTLPSGVNGGTFTLSFANRSGASDTTAAIPYDADGSAVQTALLNLSSIGSGEVSVAGPASGPYIVTFTNGLGESNQRLMSADGAHLTRLGAPVQAQELQEGNPETGFNQIQSIDLPPNVISSDPSETPYVSGGTFFLTFEGNDTEAIKYSASGSRVQEALEALPTLEAGDVLVTGPPGGPWNVEFTGNRAVTQPGFTPPTLILANGAALTGGVTAVFSTTTPVGVPLQSTATLPSPIGGQPLGGEFTLSVDGVSTAPLPFNASASQVRDALENLPNANSVAVSGPFGGPWNVTLSGSGAAGGIAGDPFALTGGILLGVASSAPTAVNEVQGYEIQGATAGTYRINFDNGTVVRSTDPIPFDATVAEVQAALEDVSTIGGPQNVIVTGSTGSPYEIEFTGDLSGIDFPQLTIDSTALTFTSIVPSPTTNGVPGTNEQQVINLTPNATGGDFTLTFQGETTTAIPFNTSASGVRQALEQLPSVESGQIVVTGSPGNWAVEFVGRLAAVDVPEISGDASNLTGGFPTIGTIDVLQTQAPANEVQEFTLTPSPVGGVFQIRFQGESTTDIPAGAAPGDVEIALEALSTIDDVAVAAVPGGYNVTFQGELSATNVQSLIVRTSDLTRNEPIDVQITQEPELTNEIQKVSLPLQVTGGDFTISFQSLTVEETTQGGGGANEEQTITLPGGVLGGTFELTYGGDATAAIPAAATATEVRDALAALPSIAGTGNVSVNKPVAGQWVVEFIGVLGDTNVALIEANGSDLTGAFTTSAIDFDASAVQVQAALEALAGLAAGDVQVTGAEINVEQNIRGRTAVNEVQSITLPANTTGGTFNLTFEGAPTGAIPANASDADIKTALDGLVAGLVVAVNGNAGGPWSVAFQGSRGVTDVELMTADASNLHVAGGPWTIEFNGALEGTSLESLVVDGSNLQTAGRGDPTVETQVQGGDGTPQQASTKRFTSFTEVEHLRIEGDDGDDIVRIIGPPSFSLGIMYDAGGGSDTLEIISNAAAPEFISPIFPDDTQAIVFVDGQAIQFADMEGGLVYDGNNLPSLASLSGTDAGNEMRFNGTGTGTATFANDGQVTTTLRNFGDGSTISLLGQQGADEIAVQLNGVTEFTTFNIDAGGPVGADTARFEGTAGQDNFAFTPGSTVEDGHVILDSTITLNYVGISGATLVGLGGLDSLTVNEAATDTNDIILFFPKVGNDGSFQLTSQLAGPETALVYPPVEFESIENRNFSTGTGIDTLSISTDDLPGVNSSASVVGGNGVTTAAFGDQSTTFTHDTANEDTLAFEIGTHTDDITVTPGTGIAIAVNSSFGDDTLIYNALGAAVTANISSRTISNTGFGDITHTGISQVELIGAGPNPLTIISGASAPMVYRPTGSNSGRISSPGVLADYSFAAFTDTLTVDFASSHDDEVIVEGTNASDIITASAVTRTVTVEDSTGTTLKTVILGSEVDILSLDARAADDTILVSPDALGGNELQFNVNGDIPNASDRLVVEDQGLGDTVKQFQGPDERSGSIIIGALPPLSYEGIEFVDIIPLDNDPSSATFGGTGADRLGRIVVFHPDTFSHNNSFLNPTELDDLAEHTAKPNINPGGQTDPFAQGFDLLGDEDWYRYTAQKTGTFQFEVVFDPVGTLANGQPGLPGDGFLRIDMFESDGTPIIRLPSETDPAVQTIGTEGGNTYLLRVQGRTPEAINLYDVRVETLDNLGPQVFDPDGAGPEHAIQITSRPTYNLFDVKPVSQGPTPLVDSITINIQDLPIRFPGFLYGALNTAISSEEGHFLLAGDHNGIIPISQIVVLNDPVVAGELATATIELRFDEPLPDDRFTLTLSDSIVDPAGNRLDGESNSQEPQGDPSFPSGDTVPGGDFVARFTVDSRPEIGVWSAGSVYVDTNGNFGFDAENRDATNEDITYVLGFPTDNLFAGNFSRNGNANGFDKLGAYGQLAGAFRWLIDTDDNGVPNLVRTDPANVNGLPVAGNFNADPLDGDEVALKDGAHWHFDTDHDHRVDVQITGNLVGRPIVGDFDGDGVDDLGAWADDVFSLDLSTILTGSSDPNSYDTNINAVTDVQFRFGFTGVREQPVAADMDGDNIDDIGLWVPDRSGANPAQGGEWYFLVSDGLTFSQGANGRVLPNLQDFEGHVVDFVPVPFGNDIFAQFGDEFALPIVGNFDPPISSDAAAAFDPLTFQNQVNSFDVNDDGHVTPGDALWVINVLNAFGSHPLAAIRSEANADGGPYLDVNGDTFVSPVDVLSVINSLNGDAEPLAEGERSWQPVHIARLPETHILSSIEVERSEIQESNSELDRPDRHVDHFFARLVPTSTRNLEPSDRDDSLVADELLDELSEELAVLWTGMGTGV